MVESGAKASKAHSAPKTNCDLRSRKGRHSICGTSLGEVECNRLENVQSVQLSINSRLFLRK